jgi:hypothetical protein
MSGRSSALPDRLKYYAARGEHVYGTLRRVRSDLEDAYAGFAARCETGPVRITIPFGAMEQALSALVALDSFVKQVGDDFAEADARDLWNGDRSRVTLYGPNSQQETIDDYVPFDHLSAGGAACTTTTDKGGLITGPDGNVYALVTPRSGDDPTWRTVTVAQGPIVQNQVSGGYKFAAGLAGMPSPFGAPASPEWYREAGFHVGPDGRPVVDGTPRGAKTTVDDDIPKTRLSATGATVGLVDIGLTHVSAAADAGHEDDGYYAVQYQVNAAGQRRALFGIYRVRTTADGSYMNVSFHTSARQPIAELDPAYKAKKKKGKESAAKK